MDDVLWTNRHEPEITDLPQADLRKRLGELVGSRLNLLFHGPEGCGKTAAAKALAKQTHSDPDNDVMIINAADFFSLSKKELRKDDRISRFINPTKAREMSKADLMNHVLRELTGNKPATGSFKTLIIDNAESMREDFQHALRRVMEQHYSSTQFIITTRERDVLIDPIQSRFVPLPVRDVEDGEKLGILEDIVEKENVDFELSGLQYIVGFTETLPEAILASQATAARVGEITQKGAEETLETMPYEQHAQTALEEATKGNISKSRSAVLDAIAGDNKDGSELFVEMIERAAVRLEEEHYKKMIRLAADADLMLADGKDPHIHIMDFLTTLNQVTKR